MPPGDRRAEQLGDADQLARQRLVHRRVPAVDRLRAGAADRPRRGSDAAPRLAGADQDRPGTIRTERPATSITTRVPACRRPTLMWCSRLSWRSVTAPSDRSGPCAPGSAAGSTRPCRGGLRTARVGDSMACVAPAPGGDAGRCSRRGTDRAAAGAQRGSPPVLLGEEPLERLVQPLDLAAGLRVIGTGAPQRDPEAVGLELDRAPAAAGCRGEHRPVVGEQLRREPVGRSGFVEDRHDVGGLERPDGPPRPRAAASGRRSRSGSRRQHRRRAASA